MGMCKLGGLMDKYLLGHHQTPVESLAPAIAATFETSVQTECGVTCFRRSTHASTAFTA